MVVVVLRKADGEPVGKKTFPPGFEQYMVDENVELSSDSFQPGMLKDAYDLMAINLDEPTIWKRPGTNKGRENPEPLAFTIGHAQKKFLSGFEIPYLYRLGNLFLDLECEPMATLIAQYIADNLKGKSMQEMSEITGIPVPMNPRDPKDIPSFEEVEKAVCFYFPDSEIAKRKIAGLNNRDPIPPPADFGEE